MTTLLATDDEREQARRIRRIKKYAGEKCLVCGKYGAHQIFEAIENLVAFARSRTWTLEEPDSRAIHEKCLTKLRELVRRMCKEECAPP